MSKAKLIAFYGGPGSGKSSFAYRLTGEMKANHINCELVTEVAKDVTWDGNFDQLKNQLFIAGKQFDRIRRLEDKVDYIIMDAGLLQNIPYFKDERYKKELTQIMINIHNSYETINYFVHRSTENKYDENGRKEGIDESLMIDDETLSILRNQRVRFTEIYPAAGTIFTILSSIEQDIRNGKS
jgi:tRNA uridine 5-carbamoylmethylation protein Kti12